MRSPISLVVLSLLVWSCVPSGDGPTTVPPTPEVTTTVVGTTTAVLGRPVVPGGIEELPPALQDQIIELVALTEEIRELRFIKPPKVVVVEAEELSTRVEELIKTEADSAEVDDLIFGLLGLIDKDIVLEDLLVELYGDQVAGYYDGDADELVFKGRKDQLTSLESSVLVHELTHALSDQHFDFFQPYNDLFDADRFDEAAGWQAIIEGDAVFSEVRRLQLMSRRDRLAFLEEARKVDTSILDSTPTFLAEQFVYPYETGVQYVAALYTNGGYESINAAYVNPPRSTEQVLRSKEEAPLEVAAPELTMPGYELVRTSTWGELAFQAMFNQEVAADSRAATVGWGGDGYRVYRNGDDIVFVMAYRGDATDDAREMAGALRKLAANSIDTSQRDGEVFTGNDFAYVAREGDAVTFVAATDPEVQALVVAQVG